MPTNREKSKRLNGILAFSDVLETQLSTAVTSKVIGTLAIDLRNFLSSFPNKFNHSNHEHIDKRGTIIWNLCTRLRRDRDPNYSDEIDELLLLGRVFAFLLLDCAYQCGNSASKNLSRLMKTGIKAAKSCIDGKNYELALKVLSKVSVYQDVVENSRTELIQGDQQIFEKVLAEYFVLRTAVAWQMGQFDIAEHMFHKATSSEKRLESNITESLADILYEMAKDPLNKKQYPLAVKWSRRALDIINSREPCELSNDAIELRTSIFQQLIKSLLGASNNDSLDEAKDLLNILEKEVGDKLVVLLLHLEILSVPSNGQFDSSAYSNVLRRIMRVVYLTEPNFKLLMFHIRKLNDKSPSIACDTIEEFFNTRVLIDGRDEYIEKVLVTRIWMTVGHRDSGDEVHRIKSMLSRISEHTLKTISPSATLAAHTLMWKKIESNYAACHYDIAEEWCKLATHTVFEKSGEINMARISRKLLLCALAKKDINNAREIFLSMTETGKNEPVSRFLMYKIAIRSGDDDMAVECLQKISSATTKDPTLLYACCLDAQQMGNKPQLLATLELVLEKFRHSSPPGVHLPSIFRLTIGLLNGMLNEPAISGITFDVNTVEKLCSTFESAASSFCQVQGSGRSTDIVWTADENDWFSKNAYNLAIKNLTDWHPSQIIRMLQCCTLFIEKYPLEYSEQVSDDLSLRKLFCEFCATTALVALARGEDNIEIQLQYYLKIRKHVDKFEAVFQEKISKMDQEAQQDLKRKFSILIAFNFEAACRLKAWDDLGNMILKADVNNTSRVYEIMADCILCADAPTQVLVSTLKMIINEAWKSETLDTVKLAKYMRCLFQITVSENAEVAEQLLDQVYSHAEEAAETDQKYPSEELEWIVTRTFNHAVDLYCCHDDEGCLNWSSKALNIAQYCMDNGALKKTLQNKLIQLKLDV